MQTLPAIRNIRPKPRQAAGRTGGLNRQSPVSTAPRSTDGFLNHSFLPLCHAAGKLPPQAETENAFYESATLLCNLHGLTPMEVRGVPYPYNILLTHRDISRKLNRQPEETELTITRTKGDRRVVLATEQAYEFGGSLFYIPVIPLYRFLRVKANKACGNLLLAVISYLYREAGIPYYRDEGSYLFDEYAMNREFFLESVGEEPDEYEEDLSDIVRNEICGDIMHRKIYNRYHLEHFAENIEKFDPQNELEEECLVVAKEALQLSLDFPGNWVFQNIDSSFDEEEVATPEAFVSFIGDSRGWVFDSIQRQINDYLGNFAEIAIPKAVRVHDGTASEIKDLKFEYRLFELIENLSNILYDLL
ncbi:hypothetical protein SAMN05421821_101344 [Mucilaginibacter lappiensis]|uniref:Uncharacterized protein n=1 Tax=Mucilaginibacter lappiensis TaxID=354630 RepID=A0ABR6PDA6_9SPHI|nr:hypothetical protein [Mucilaginibacter lappiensis]MBB6107740.1 hypothetical protein [Mucilaginibacter lappiensis]SIP98605.1 hypothetical protein SAMN05421821_101344 [Mucilaginibacter lappiensis]